MTEKTEAFPDSKAKIGQFPSVLDLQNISWLDISVYNIVTDQISIT
jgi:hypothetical protein